jgi:hypothetical protein
MEEEQHWTAKHLLLGSGPFSKVEHDGPPELRQAPLPLRLEIP